MNPQYIYMRCGHKIQPREVMRVAAKTKVAPASDPQAQRALFQKLVNMNCTSTRTYPIRYHRSDTPPKPRFADNEERQRHLAKLWRQRFLRLIPETVNSYQACIQARLKAYCRIANFEQVYIGARTGARIKMYHYSKKMHTWQKTKEKTISFF